MSLVTAQIDNYENIIETIRNNIQWLNEYNSNQTKSRRNLLNKWFLDSIKNYFMEQHAAPLLLKDLNFKSTQQVREIVQSQIDASIPKYMSIIKNYFELLRKFNKDSKFKSGLLETLSQNIEDFSKTDKQTNYIVQKTIRKQFVGLLVITYCDFNSKVELNSFYDLWNVVFPNDKQTKMRLSKYDMIKENSTLKNKVKSKLRKQPESKQPKSSLQKLNNQSASESTSANLSQQQSQYHIEEISFNKNSDNTQLELINQNIQNIVQIQHSISQQKYSSEEIINQLSDKSSNYSQKINSNENEILFKEETQIILPLYEEYQQQQLDCEKLKQKIEYESNYDNSQQISAQNLKQLEYLYSIQNEKQNIQENFLIKIENDQTSSLSVNINTDVEFFSSQSRLDDEYNENYYQYNAQQEQYQYANEQMNEYQNHFESSALNQIFPQISCKKEEQTHQELCEYPLSCIQDQTVFPSYQQVDTYASYYCNEFHNNQEEFIDSLFNYQKL